MNPDTLIQKGNPGYSKQQKQMRESSVSSPSPAPINQQVATTIDGKQYNAGGGVISPYQTTITSQNMQPTAEVKLPPPVVPQGTAQAQGAVNAAVASNKQQQAEVKAQAEQDIPKGLSEIMGINEQIAGAEGTIDRTAEKAKQAESNRLASEIEQEQLAVTNQVNELRRTNPQGVFGGALEDQIRDIERESLIRQTQKAVLLNAANRDYESAVANTKLELDLKLKPLQAKLENAKLFYQENKELFNKQDERAYKERIAKEEREYNKIEKAETALQQTRSKLLESAVSQGAPSSVVKGIMGAQTDLEAINAAGQYSGDILARTLKLKSIDETNLKIRKLSEEINATKQTLSTPTVPGSHAGTVQTLLNSAKNDKYADNATKEKIAKSNLIVDQLSDLQSTIAKRNTTGLIQGGTAKILNSLGLDANAGLVQAQLTALVPQLARGTYGEVGVLTEPDTKAYKATLPNLTSSQQKNDLVTAMTLNVVAKGLKNTLEVEATNGVNMSGNVAKYNEIIAKKAEIEDRIGVTATKLAQIGISNPNLEPMIQEMEATGMRPSQILEALGAEY